MKVPGVVEGGVIRPLSPIAFPDGTEVDIVVESREKASPRRHRGTKRSRKPATRRPPLAVEDISPIVEIDDKEIARRKAWWKKHQKLEPIDIRPLTTEQLVREDRESH